MIENNETTTKFKNKGKKSIEFFNKQTNMSFKKELKTK
jgi:hypothetical protein